MNNSPSKDNSAVKIAVMGAAGTGKSTFINLLTNDDSIRIGYNAEIETSEIHTAYYTDEKTGRRVMLIDTPGFDDSREGVTDTDVLEQIFRFLEPETGERQKLNGLIYMHRISDPRIGGQSRKNIRMFKSLCGEQTLRNVRIVTTSWDRVSEAEGLRRKDALERAAFKDLIDGGAQILRHTNTIESARKIVSDLIRLPPVTTQVQEEIGVTAAGSVLNADLRALQEKHKHELVDLKREMEEAGRANDAALRAEWAKDRLDLEKKLALAENDLKRLERTLEQARQDHAAVVKSMEALRKSVEKDFSI